MAFSIPALVASGDFGKASWANNIRNAIAEHVHDVTDGTAQLDLGDMTGSLPASSVGQSQLKVGTRSTTTRTTPVDVATGLYDFPPQAKIDAGASTLYVQDLLVNGRTVVSTFNPGVAFYSAYRVYGASAVGDVHAQNIYIQASPPYAMGGSEDWGLWAYVMRDIATGEIVATTIQDDAPWGLVPSALPKMHPARVALQPTPWLSAIPEGHEVVLVDLRHMEELEEIDGPEKETARALVAQRDRWAAQGHDVADLERFERIAEEAASLRPKIRARRSSALLSWCRKNGACLSELVHGGTSIEVPTQLSGLVAMFRESVQATDELREKDRRDIPAPLLAHGVRVLRAPSRAL